MPHKLTSDRLADRPVTIRLPDTVIARLDGLARRLSRDPAAAAHGKPSRSTALRLALLSGLDALDRRRER